MKKGQEAVTLRAKRDKQGKDTMKKKPLVEWKQLTIRVPVEVHRALKVRAAEEGRSLAVIIEGMVREYLVGGKKV
jgi:predicted HicB family RNase H-like nuclease